MTLQGLVTIVVGFIGMAAIVMIGHAALSAMKRRPANNSDASTRTDLAIDYVLGMLAALGGGILTAWLAPFAPMYHAIALGVLVLAMAVTCAISYGDSGPPRWYQAVLSLSSAAVVLAGAWLTAITA